MKNKSSIIVKNIPVSINIKSNPNFISLTDIARYKDKKRTNYIIQNWMRSKDTIEFLGLWERINNKKFKSIEFDAFKKQAGSNSFSLTPQKWIKATNAVGVFSKAGRYGGTYAHQDIAFEFAAWISAEFKLFLIKEFQRLKQKEVEKDKLGWNLKRNLAAVNYKIHTDAIKKHLIPQIISSKQSSFTYANEADVLNKALFGMTAKVWREENSKKEGNIRDYSTVEQLVCLSNLESLNSEFIKEGLSQGKRLKKLNEIAISQMKILLNVNRKILLKAEKTDNL